MNRKLDIQDLKNIELSVVIVTFKSRSVIDACLESILRMNDIGDRLEVIVVDNSPAGDDTNDYISAKFPWAKLLRNEENRGFGQANNVGVRSSGGDVVLFLNPDTILTEPIFSYTLQRFQTDSRLAVCGYLLRTPNGKLGKSFGILPDKKFFLPAWSYLPLIKYAGYTPPNVYPWGAAMAIRRDIFLSIHGFDEDYFMCYEEPDLIHRMDKNWKTAIVNRSLIHLDGHTSEFQGITRRTEIALESERRYFAKYGLNYDRFVAKTRVSLTVKRFLKWIHGAKLGQQDAILLQFYSDHLRRARVMREKQKVRQ